MPDDEQTTGQRVEEEDRAVRDALDDSEDSGSQEPSNGSGTDTPTDEQIEEDQQTLDNNRDRRVDERKEAVRASGETSRTAESFVVDNEETQEDILQDAFDLGQENEENQVELNGKMKRDFHNAVELKRGFEGEQMNEWFREVALDEDQIAGLDRDSADRLTLEDSTSNPVSVQDGLKVVEADLVNRGVFGEARGQYKGLFDNHLEETGERNDPVADVASNRARNSDEARELYEDHKGKFSDAVDELLNETLENPQEGRSTMEVQASNMEERAEEYEDIKSDYQDVVEHWDNAQTVEDVDVPEGAPNPDGALDKLRGMIQDLGGRAEIDTSEKEEVQKAWAWYRAVAADSMNEQLQRMNSFKNTLEGVKEDFQEAKDRYVDMQDDVEDLEELDNVGDSVADALEDHGYNTILDVADRENGGDFLNAFDLSPFGDDLSASVKGNITEDEGDVIYNSAIEAAERIAEEHGFDQLTDQVAGIIGDDESTDVMQLAGAYEQASEFINVVTDVIERVESELDEYPEEIQGEDVESYVQSELEDSYDELNSYLAEEQEVGVGELPDDPQELFEYDLSNVEA